MIIPSINATLTMAWTDVTLNYLQHLKIMDLYLKLSFIPVTPTLAEPSISELHLAVKLAGIS